MAHHVINVFWDVGDGIANSVAVNTLAQRYRAETETAVPQCVRAGVVHSLIAIENC
jgi:hypothetical protein